MRYPGPVFLCLCIVLPVWDGSVAAAVRDTDKFRDTVVSLGDRVEAMVAKTRPLEWPELHACLYYALAGQRLLAEAGISTRLVQGTVVYGPYIAGQHKINPHIWLETATHIIDYATLPRWGEVSVIPRSLAARNARAVTPGLTRILAWPRPRSAPEQRFIMMHRARFEQALKRGD